MTTQAIKRVLVTLFLFGSIALISPSPAVAAGVTGIDIYVINSNGVRCGQDCVSQSQAQVAMCVRSGQIVVNYTDMSYGYTLRQGAAVISAGSYSPLSASSTCVGGYMHTWDFRDLSAGETYVVEAWMIDDYVSHSATLVVNTPDAYDPSSSTTINPLSTSTTVAVESLIPGAPQIDMYEGPSVGAWNLVDNASGVVLQTIVGSPLCCGRNGTYRSTEVAQTATYVWNPIGAGSGGQYYTNGLYVTAWGQHVLPGTSSLIAVVGPPPTTPSDEQTDSEGSSTTSTTIAAVAGARSVAVGASVVGLADVGLIIQKSGSKYSIVATSPMRNSSVVIKATAKGKPTITWSAKTNVNAQKLIMSTRSLKGYTISLWVNGRRLSSVKAG